MKIISDRSVERHQIIPLRLILLVQVVHFEGQVPARERTVISVFGPDLIGQRFGNRSFVIQPGTVVRIVDEPIRVGLEANVDLYAIFVSIMKSVAYNIMDSALRVRVSRNI